MKMIENYLNSLESYLPEDMKQEVREEFGASIYEQFEDRQEQLNRDLTQDEQEELLVKIGHPMQVAARFLPNQKLIGESYFPAYKKALKLAIMIVFAIKLIFTLPTLISSGHIIGSSITLVWSFLYTALWVFGNVTLIFYLMQRYGFDSKHLYSFSAKDLQASSPKLSLNRIDTVFELLFLVLFIAWWNNIFYWLPTEYFTIAILNASMSPEWQGVFWSVNIVIGLFIINCIYKLACGNYNRTSLITDIVLNVATILIIIQISSFSKFVVIAESDLTDINWAKLEPILNMGIYSILGFILVVSCWDIFNSGKKLRYFKATH